VTKRQPREAATATASDLLLSDDELDAYLRFLEVDGRPAPTVATLRLLHREQLRRVRFENSSVLRGEPIILDASALVDKIVRRHRGGFCYELNGAFAALLRSLGFRVDLLAARVYGEGGVLGPPFDHLCLRVTLPEGPFLADVGFGYSFVEPLRLVLDAEQVDATGRFRLVAVSGAEGGTPDGEGIEIEWLHSGGVWRPHFRFDLVPHELWEYEETSRFHQTSPESPFPRDWVCAAWTGDGWATLDGRRFVRSDGSGIVERRQVSEDDLGEILARWFGVKG
jgi:N-hydroxyarylamine O-acetyltransferase